MQSSPKIIRDYLTKKNLLAVALIAVIFISNYAFNSIIVRTQDSIANVINVSGKQRMLSQRIALFATQLVALEPTDQDITRNTLKELIAAMRNGHRVLTTGDLSRSLPSSMGDTVQNMYFNAPMHLDKRVKEYLGLAEDVSELTESQLSTNAPAFKALLAQSPRLLQSLNKIVNQYEQETKNSLEVVYFLQFISLFLCLLILILVFVFIFRPMVKSISSLHTKVIEKEQLLNTFITKAPAAVAMLDREMKYLIISERWYSNYQLENRNLIGKHYGEALPLSKQKTEFIDLFKRVIDGQHFKIEEQEVALHNNKTAWFRYEFCPWMQADGEVGGIISFSEDITERKQIDLIKNEFVSTVSHELRTPLTSLQLSLGLLRKMALDDLDVDGKRVLNMATENCRRLTHLVNDILDMQKIAAGKIDFKFEKVEVCSLVKDIIDRHRTYADRYQVTFELQFEVDRVYCLLDSSRFNQALVNLLSNASKFSPEGESVTIGIKKRTENQLEVSVTDKGSGIPDSFKHKIFEKFAQADSLSTRAQNGTGLGLNITKSIIEAFNGEIYFESEVNKGSTFYFLLPVYSDQQEKGVM